LTLIRTIHQTKYWIGYVLILVFEKKIGDLSPQMLLCEGDIAVETQISHYFIMRNLTKCAIYDILVQNTKGIKK